MNAYQSYVAFCERLGIKPLDEMQWRAAIDAIPISQQGKTNGRSAGRLHITDKVQAGKHGRPQNGKS